LKFLKYVFDNSKKFIRNSRIFYMLTQFKRIGLINPLNTFVSSRYDHLIGLLSNMSEDQYNQDSGEYCGTHQYAFPARDEIIVWARNKELRQQLLSRDIFIFVGTTSSGVVKGFACSIDLFGTQSECLVDRFKSATMLNGSGLDLVHTDLDVDAVKFIYKALENPKEVPYNELSTVADHRALYDTYQTLRFSDCPFDDFLLNSVSGETSIWQIAFVSAVVAALPDVNLSPVSNRLAQFIESVNGEFGRKFESKDNPFYLPKSKYLAGVSVFLRALHEPSDQCHKPGLMNIHQLIPEHIGNLASLDPQVATHLVKLVRAKIYDFALRINLSRGCGVGFLRQMVRASRLVDHRLVGSVVSCLSIYWGVRDALREFNRSILDNWSAPKEGDRFDQLNRLFIGEILAFGNSREHRDTIISISPNAAKHVLDIAMLYTSESREWSVYMVSALARNERNLEPEIFGNRETVSILRSIHGDQGDEHFEKLIQRIEASLNLGEYRNQSVEGQNTQCACVIC